MSEHIDKLKSLHTTLIDSRNGYEEAFKDSEGRGLASLFREMISLREGSAAELETYLRTAGEEPNEDGSFLSTVHRTIISIRSLFGELDERLLPGLIDGEKRILSYYDDVIVSATGDLQVVLARQRKAVAEKIAEMESRKLKAA